MKVLALQKSYGGYESLEIYTKNRAIHGNSTSFVLEDHDYGPQIYTQYHSGLNDPPVTDDTRQVLQSYYGFGGEYNESYLSHLMSGPGECCIVCKI